MILASVDGLCIVCSLLIVVEPQEQHIWTRIVALLRAAAKEFSYDHCSRMAAAIAYRTVFALAPLLLIAVAVASLFLDDPATGCDADVENCQTIQEQLVEQVNLISTDLGNTVTDIMESALKDSGRNGVIGLGLFLFTASSLFAEIQGSLNAIFHAPERHLRGLVAQLRGRSIGAMAVLVLGALLVALFVANAFVAAAGSLLVEGLDNIGLDSDLFAPLISIAGPLVTLLFLILVFAVQFQAFPAVKVPWRAAWRGASVTGVAFAGGALLLGALAGSDALSFSASGFAGGLVLLLFLVFILSQIYLFGAEITKTYADYLRHGDVRQPSLREQHRPPEVTDEMLRQAATTDVIARVGVFAFVAGLFLGMFKRR